MIENYAFDQIYHEHLLYYNLRSLESLAQSSRFRNLRFEEVSIHGGSCIAYVAHKGSRKRLEI